MSKKQFNQLSLVQRSQLQTLLKEKDSLAKISVEMNLSRQTLYREILRNSFPISCDKPGLKSSCINYLKCHKEKKSYRLECPSDCINYQPGRQYCVKRKNAVIFFIIITMLKTHQILITKELIKQMPFLKLMRK